MAPCAANRAGSEVRIQVSVPVEIAAVMGLAVLMITVGLMVSLMLLVVVIHSGDVFLVCLHSDLFNCEGCVPLKDCWIDWGERWALWFSLWFGGYCNILELVVLRIADELLPVIIIVVRTRVVMRSGFATASAQIVRTICKREAPARGGLVLRYVCGKRRYGEVVASDSVGRDR